MKTKSMITLLAATIIAVLLSLPCLAEEKTSEFNWDDDTPPPQGRMFKLTDEGIEKVMARLKEQDPNKAAELAQLRTKDPKAFEDEFRNVMREGFRKRLHERLEQKGEWHERMSDMNRPPKPGHRSAGEAGAPSRVRPGPGPAGEAGELSRVRIRRPGPEPEEIMNWLKENYPEQAKELAELKEKDQQLYDRKLGLCGRKYGYIIDAYKTNPELGKVLKEDSELKEKRNDILEKIKASTDEKEKQQLKQQLTEVISGRFDLLMKRKEIRYESMLKRLEELKKEVNESKAELEKQKTAEYKDQNVKAHVEELIGRAEKFDWN